MMFQAQNMDNPWNVAIVLQDHYDNERDKTVFLNATSDLQDQDHSMQDQDQDRFFFVLDRSCPKTDGFRPHHWA